METKKGLFSQSSITCFSNEDEFSSINSFNKRFSDISRILKNLEDCGKIKKFECHCKQCKSNKSPSLVHVSKHKVYCDIRYCFNPYCINERFARQLEGFNKIKRLKNLRNLWHFAIGFEPISKEEFKNNFPKYKKRFEIVLTNFWRKFKQTHHSLIIPAIRVMDFSFEKEGYVYVHYHYGAIPFKNNDRRLHMILIKDIEKSMNENMKIKTPFFLKSFGMKKKEAIFCYLSKRASGLYKYGEGKNLSWGDYKKGKLIQDIKDNKYLGLKDFINELEYYDYFYNTRATLSVGDLPQACIPVRNSLNNQIIICNIHGILNSKDIIVEIYDDPPPT